MVIEIFGVSLITARDSSRVRGLLPSRLKRKPDKLVELKHDLFGTVRSVERAVDEDNTFERRSFLDKEDDRFRLFHDTIVPEIWRDQGISSFDVIGEKVEKGEGTGDFGDDEGVKIQIQPDSSPSIHVDNCADRITDAISTSYYFKGWVAVGLGFVALLIAQLIRFCIFL
ncbi:MAG: hypothetical protein ABEI96_04060 [Haloarculaceae archaeon]